MKSLEENYAQLIALTQLYLLQEYSLGQKIVAESETFSFFKELALQQKKGQQQAVAAPPQFKQPLPQPKVALAPQVQPKIQSVVVPEQKVQVTNVEPKKNSVTSVPSVVKPSPAPEPTPPTSPSQITLQQMDSPKPSDFASLRTLLQKSVPSFAIVEEIPSDKRDSRVVEVVVVAPYERDAEKDFLHQVTKAIDLHLFPAALLEAEHLEKEGGWEAWLRSSKMRLLLISYHSLEMLPGLKTLLRERNSKYYCGDVPILFLNDVSRYLNEPQLKSELWKTLKRELPK